MIAKAKQEASKVKQRQEGVYSVGTRVFHETFGVGKILEVVNNSSSSSYVVEFTKAGVKTLDSLTSNLKTF